MLDFNYFYVCLDTQNIQDYKESKFHKDIDHPIVLVCDIDFNEQEIQCSDAIVHTGSEEVSRDAVSSTRKYLTKK